MPPGGAYPPPAGGAYPPPAGGAYAAGGGPAIAVSRTRSNAAQSGMLLPTDTFAPTSQPLQPHKQRHQSLAEWQRKHKERRRLSRAPRQQALAELIQHARCRVDEVGCAAQRQLTQEVAELVWQRGQPLI